MAKSLHSVVACLFASLIFSATSLAQCVSGTTVSGAVSPVVFRSPTGINQPLSFSGSGAPLEIARRPLLFPYNTIGYGPVVYGSARYGNNSPYLQNYPRQMPYAGESATFTSLTADISDPDKRAVSPAKAAAKKRAREKNAKRVLHSAHTAAANGATSRAKSYYQRVLRIAPDSKFGHEANAALARLTKK